MNTSVERALEGARFFRSLGYQPLPSRTHVKGPMLAEYADFWDRPLPDATYDEWTAINVQVMTGAHWKLCVVDCDGDEAHDQFRLCKNRNGTEGPLPTWVVKSGGDGWHYYFTLPAWLPECPSRLLWGLWDTWGGTRHEGGWAKHKEVRLLADHALVIAPPSVHVDTGRAYEFLDGHSPQQYPRPMEAPGWLLRLPAQVPPQTVQPLAPYRPAAATEGPRRPPGPFHSREEVLAAIPDKAALAASWGLVIARETPNPRGWVTCHSVYRKDAHPSASFSPSSGVYTEDKGEVCLSLFDLAAALGAYPDWNTARVELGRQFLDGPSRTCMRTHAHAGKTRRAQTESDSEKTRTRLGKNSDRTEKRPL